MHRREDTATRGGLDIAKKLVAEPPYNIHVWIRNRHALL